MNQNKNNLEDLSGPGEKSWVNWSVEMRDEKPTKVPHMPNGQMAKSTDPATWSSYAEVVAARERFYGIGIVFSGKLLGIDLDHVLKNGKISKKELEEFIEKAHTYTEISPSNTGLHLFLRLTEPMTLDANKSPRGQGGDYECYTSGRYFTVTGNEWEKSYPIRTITPTEALEILKMLGYPWGRGKDKDVVKEVKVPVEGNNLLLDDAVILEKMFSSKNGDKIKSIYEGDISEYGNDDSSADAALCAHLAFWTGKNSEQMDRIWLASPLGQRGKTTNREDYRKRTIDFATSNCKEIYTGEEEDGDMSERNGSSQANALLKAIFDRKDVVLFHDSQGNGYISLDMNGHQEVWACGSKKIKKWLSNEVYRLQKKAPKAEVIKSILAVLEGRACFDGKEIELQNRVAWYDKELWYDLTNKEWQAVKINKDGWEIVDKPPILFKRYPHHRAQVQPVRNGNVKLFLNYVNMPNPEHKLLLLVSLISCFVPDFPHVMEVIFGAQGASKSTLSKLERLVMDPSLIDVASFPNSERELIQALAHHYFLFFDNVSHISEEQSDTLCRAITGGGHVKRELYENDEDIIYNFMRCLGINGINLITTRPDLLERSLLLELERIEPAKRRTEKELYASFKGDLPSILGGVFDTLVKTLNIMPTIKLESHHRMADWANWGCAIAEALGHTKEEFLNAYQNNITRQTEMLLNENIVAAAVIVFMEDKDDWRGTPTELLRQLSTNASFAEIDTREKYWPKGANVLSRRLNELSTPLKQMGYLVTIDTSGTERWIRIQKTPKEIQTDSTDDKNSTLKDPGPSEEMPF